MGDKYIMGEHIAERIQTRDGTSTDLGSKDERSAALQVVRFTGHWYGVWGFAYTRELEALIYAVC